MNALQCARYVYQTEGIRGFYRGLTASYAGISETMICFLIYEALKKKLAEGQLTSPSTEMEKGPSDFLGLMLAAAFSKGCASCIAYPHGTSTRPPHLDDSVMNGQLFMFWELILACFVLTPQRSSGPG